MTEVSAGTVLTADTGTCGECSAWTTCLASVLMAPPANTCILGLSFPPLLNKQRMLRDYPCVITALRLDTKLHLAIKYQLSKEKLPRDRKRPDIAPLATSNRPRMTTTMLKDCRGSSTNLLKRSHASNVALKDIMPTSAPRDISLSCLASPTRIIWTHSKNPTSTDMWSPH